MLWISNENTNPLNFIIDKIESEMMGLQVVAMNQWNLPVEKQEVAYTLSNQRKMTVLEEFVMNSAILVMSVDADISLISSLLGLDEVFVNACVDELCSKNILEKTALPVIKLTKTGEEYFERGMVPDKTTTEEITFYIDRKFGMSYAKIIKDDTYGLYVGYETINRSIEDIKKYINRNFIVIAGKDQGKVIEHPKLGKRISSLVSVKTLEKTQTLMSELWVYDIIDDRVFCRVWDHAKGTFRKDIADFIEKHAISNKFSVEKRLNPTGIAHDIQALMCQIRSESCDGLSIKKKIPIQVFHGSEIKLICEKSLELPKEQLIMFSPWINEYVFDGQVLGKFKKLAKKNIQILIGCGLSDNIANEKTSPTSELMKEFFSIKNEDGIPMVCLLHLGNKHEKEIVIDSEIHITGSFNWLSYRGDYRPCDESIYYIQDTMIVKKQRDYWENICIPVAKETLFQAENPLQMIATLQFLFRTMPKNSFSQLCETLISQIVAEKSPDILYNILTFCVMNDLCIFEAISAVSYMIGIDEYAKKTKSILAYLKFHQPQDFKEICTNHDKQLKLQFGKSYSKLTPSDYKKMTFI